MTHKIIEGKFNGQGKRFALVVGRFNELVTTKLLSGAIDCLNRHEVPSTHITETWVPGAFEIPLICKKLAESKNYDAIIALGCVIRGSTSHYDYVCSEVAKGISQTSLQTGIPVIFGVLTTENIEQALERAGTKAGNKGWEAALNALEMASLCGQFH